MERRRAPGLPGHPEPALALHTFDVRKSLSEQAVIIASMKVQGCLDEVERASEWLKPRPH